MEALQNDERMKHVTDMITGIRTIKAYAWEPHYIEKIREKRKLQLKTLYYINGVASLGFSFFQNFGLIAILTILLSKWYKGEELSLSMSFSLIAMVYYLFMNVNNMAFGAF